MASRDLKRGDVVRWKHTESPHYVVSSQSQLTPAAWYIEVVGGGYRQRAYAYDLELVAVEAPTKPQADDVKAPSHYFVELRDGTRVECKHVTRALGLSWALGNAFKYLWRAGRKTPDKLKDLRKAREMLDDEIRALEAESHGQ